MLNRRVRGGVIAAVGLGVVVLGIATASFWVEPTAGSVGGRRMEDDSHAEIRDKAAIAKLSVDGGQHPRLANSFVPSPPVGAVAPDSRIVPAKPGYTPVRTASAHDLDPQTASPAPSRADVPATTKDATTHRGPEPVGDDPCVVPIYYDWFERRTHLTPADTPRLTVRVTAENYTTPWWLRPNEPGILSFGP